MSKEEETKQGISIENNEKERNDGNYLGSKIPFKKKLQIAVYSILRGINPTIRKFPFSAGIIKVWRRIFMEGYFKYLEVGEQPHPCMDKLREERTNNEVTHSPTPLQIAISALNRNTDQSLEVFAQEWGVAPNSVRLYLRIYKNYGKNADFFTLNDKTGERYNIRKRLRMVEKSFRIPLIDIAVDKQIMTQKLKDWKLMYFTFDKPTHTWIRSPENQILQLEKEYYEYKRNREKYKNINSDISQKRLNPEDNGDIRDNLPNKENILIYIDSIFKREIETAIYGIQEGTEKASTHYNTPKERIQELKETFFTEGYKELHDPEINKNMGEREAPIINNYGEAQRATGKRIPPGERLQIVKEYLATESPIPVNIYAQYIGVFGKSLNEWVIQYSSFGGEATVFRYLNPIYCTKFSISQRMEIVREAVRTSYGLAAAKYAVTTPRITYWKATYFRGVRASLIPTYYLTQAQMQRFEIK